MNSFLRRATLCLVAAVSGLALGAAAWFLFFGYYLFVLSTLDPLGKTILLEIGPQLCALIGMLSGAFICGASGFIRLRKQNAMLAVAGFNFALAMLVISDDAQITAPGNLRTLVICSAIFQIITGLVAGWLVSTLYTFLGEILDGTYRGTLFGLNGEKEEEITSLNIGAIRQRRIEREAVTEPIVEPIIEPIIEPVSEPILEPATAAFVEEEAVPELLFEPGRDWDFISGTKGENHDPLFEYVAMDLALSEEAIGEMLAGLLPFEAASETEKITSQHNFQLYKQRLLTAGGPRITYRNGSLKPQKNSETPQDAAKIELTA